MSARRTICASVFYSIGRIRILKASRHGFKRDRISIFSLWQSMAALIRGKNIISRNFNHYKIKPINEHGSLTYGSIYIRILITKSTQTREE